ncbi:GerMN domain-containing protein [Candidatus Parcubacteria bacterium]|nr:GerMN domain-containing protein [Candidatus Parcubacteria bacterium]
MNRILIILLGILVVVGVFALGRKYSVPAPASMPERTSVTLYYYNPMLDQGPGGVECSEKGLVSVARTIPKTATVLQDSIALLLEGRLTEEERAQGITTEFPLSGVSLVSASIVDGIATLTFVDPEHQTSGGSCRVTILRAEIEATAKQFPSVQNVRFKPDDLFQP